MAVWYPIYIYPEDFDREDTLLCGWYRSYPELEQCILFYRQEFSDGQKLFSALAQVYEHLFARRQMTILSARAAPQLFRRWLYDV